MSGLYSGEKRGCHRLQSLNAALDELTHRIGEPADGGDAQELLAVDLPGVGQQIGRASCRERV